MMDNSEKIQALKAEIENLQQQMKNEIVAIDNKKSLFMTQKRKDQKVSDVFAFYTGEIAKKQIEIEELLAEEDDEFSE